MWRNRQTRWIQVPVVATPCGFKSHHPHQEKSQNLFGFWLFLYDDIELKPLQKKDAIKEGFFVELSQKIFSDSADEIALFMFNVGIIKKPVLSSFENDRGIF